MLIEPARLIIRPYTFDDVERLLPILADPTTMAFWPRPFTPEEVEGWVERNIARHREDGVARYPLLLKDGETLIGDCGIIKVLVAGETVYDLGYIVHFPYWRQGYAIEAALALKQYAFDELDLPALHANMPHGHVASRRVAEKLGMQRVKEFDNPRNRNIRTYLYMISRPQPA